MKKLLRIVLAILNILFVALAAFININPNFFGWDKETTKIVMIIAVGLTVVSVLWLIIWAIIDDTKRLKAHKCSCCEQEKAEEEIEELAAEEPAPVIEEVVEEAPAEEPVEEVVEEEPVEEEPVEEETPAEEVVEEEEEPAPLEEAAPVILDDEEEDEEEAAPYVQPVAEGELIGLFDHPMSEVLLYEGLVARVGSGWRNFFKAESKKDYWNKTMNALKNLYQKKVIYPAATDILKPFEYTDLENVRVVIIGKIPYYRKNQADGLAFSSNKNADINAATKIIIKEAMDDVGIKEPANGSFEEWAKHGVFLFNTVLTAPSDKPASHQQFWTEFANDVLMEVIKHPRPKVFILWGEHAKQYKSIIDLNPDHIVLEASNPSPLSAMNGFYGSKPFSQANKYLVSKGYKPVDWKL